MEKLELYIPKLEDLWFYQQMTSDPETMSYNANWDVDYDGYHRDTGCIRKWRKNGVEKPAIRSCEKCLLQHLV